MLDQTTIDGIRAKVTELLAEGLPPEQVSHFLKAGYYPLPGGQRKFHIAARAADWPNQPRFILIEGNRGGGKTHAALAQVLLDDCHRADVNALILRRIGLAMREQMESRQSRFLLPGTSMEYARNTGVIRLGQSIVRLGHYHSDRDVDRYLGQEYDVILVEELTQLTLNKFLDIVSCLRTSKPGWRPRLYATTNPEGIGFTWVKRLWISRRYSQGEFPGDYTSIRVMLNENPYLDQEEYLRSLGSLSEVKYKAWVEGSWDIATGQFFDFDRSRVVRPKMEEVPHYWQTWGAYDYGWTHPSAWLSFAMDSFKNVWTIREWGGPRKPLWEQVAEIAAWPEAKRWRFVACSPDMWGHYDDEGNTIAAKLEKALREVGIHAVLRPASPGRIQGAAEVLHRLGGMGKEPTWFICENCVRLIETLGYLQHDPHQPEDVLKVNADDQGEGGDDFYDAARYGLMAISQGAAPYRPMMPGYAPKLAPARLGVPRRRNVAIVRS